MGDFYIHKVGHQEMGSVKYRGDKPSRGRYFLISKSCLDFFPHISSVVMNDKVILSVVPMMKGEETKKVLCTMDYHNQKFADIEYRGKNPRNEIRIYMNNEIDPDKQYFHKGDYAVFEKLFCGDDFCYSLTRIPADHEKCNVLQCYLDSFDKRFRSNAIVSADLDFIKTPNLDAITDVVITNEANRVIEKESDSLLMSYEHDETNTNEENNSLEESMGYSIFTSSLFHNLVMNAYKYKCAITGKVIRYKEGKTDLFNLEAAHIKPQAHQGTFLPCNGIAMSRDMHFAFDKGFFTISDDYKVVVSEKLRGSWLYEEYNGKQIYVPEEPFYRPQPVFLRHHREKVFETFRQIRRESNIVNYPSVNDEPTVFSFAAESGCK